MPRRSINSENSGDYNCRRLWETPSKNFRGDMQELGYTRSQGISRSPKPLSFSNIPPNRQNSLSCPETQQTFPLKTSSSSGSKRWRQDKRSRSGWSPSCTNTRTDCRRITSTCELGWRPSRPINHWDLPAHSLHLVPIKARRSLYPTTLTYRWMTNYLPTAFRSHGVHHPRTSRKPNPEKSPLIDPADLSVPCHTRYGKKPSGTDASRSRLMNMRSSDLEVSTHRYHPCTLPSGLLLPHTCFSPPPSGQHVLDYDSPHGFSISSFAMYDGSSDPYDHILHFNQVMILNVGDDRLLCKVFPTSLKGPALAWFHKIPRGSINSFSELWAVFIAQYMCSVRKKGNISSLQAILKREDESIWDFTRRFGQAVQQIDIYSMDVVLQNF